MFTTHVCLNFDFGKSVFIDHKDRFPFFREETRNINRPTNDRSIKSKIITLSKISN